MLFTDRTISTTSRTRCSRGKVRTESYCSCHETGWASGEEVQSHWRSSSICWLCAWDNWSLCCTWEPVWDTKKQWQPRWKAIEFLDANVDVQSINSKTDLQIGEFQWFSDECFRLCRQHARLTTTASNGIQEWNWTCQWSNFSKQEKKQESLSARSILHKSAKAV